MIAQHPGSSRLSRRRAIKTSDGVSRLVRREGTSRDGGADATTRTTTTRLDGSNGGGCWKDAIAIPSSRRREQGHMRIPPYPTKTGLDNEPTHHPVDLRARSNGASRYTFFPVSHLSCDSSIPRRFRRREKRPMKRFRRVRHTTLRPLRSFSFIFTRRKKAAVESTKSPVHLRSRECDVY